MDIIKLQARYGTKNYLQKARDKAYFLRTEFNSMRAGFSNDGRRFVDPSGGPMLIEGTYLEEAGAVIKSIDAIDGGTLITFE